MKTRILYFHNGLSSFVKKDISILEQEFELKIHYFDQSKKSRLATSFLFQLIFLFFNIWTSKTTVVQFAGYHSFLPVLFGKIFNKKVSIVLGGNDTVSFPSIQYGCFYNKNMRFFTSFSIKYCTLLLPVSESLVLYDYTYDKSDYNQQGYLFHMKGTKTPPFKVIYNGYSSEEWPFVNEKEKNTFITVAADLSTRFGPKLKGIDLIIEVAPSFPNCQFFIVGGDQLKGSIPSNVIAIGNVPHQELKEIVGNKQFYLQLSMSEGFPNALCEAMLTGCIPIVSNTGAMPMIVDNSGFVLNQKNNQKLIELIQTALKSPLEELSVKARKRITENFSIDKRQTELLASVRSTI